jgi:anthranilate synthase/phosphoribosyltransferase
MILVIDNYDSFTYNLVQLVAALGVEVEVERNDAVTAEQVIDRAPAGIIISPGPGTPDDSGVSRDVIRAAIDAEIPLLGVCLGHQCIADVLGGEVVRGPVPIHGKTAQVHHDGTDLLEGLPSPFTATRYHSLMVDPDSVPDELAVSARTEDGIIMALTHRELPVYGMQFHPESVLTPEGTKMLARFLEIAGETPVEEHAEVEEVPAPNGSSTLVGAIGTVITGGSLEEDQAAKVMGAIMDGDATPAQIASLVTALRMKGETVDEITGFARAMRQRAEPVRPASEDLVDTCGTGGDSLGSFNISTVTAFVVAGAGVPIAKHGNRSVSSKCGSADVLEALGVSLDLGPEAMARCIDEAGVGFLFAPALHPSMRHAGPPRREIATRTVFNILGPLTNPAGAGRQLLGVYDPSLTRTMAEVAGRLGVEHALVVHGHPGMDEVSASGPTVVAELKGGSVTEYEITPEELGIARGTVEALAGGDAQQNAGIARAVLGGEHGPRRDVVLMNASAALLAAEAVADLAEGVAKARESIDGGEALARLEALVTVSRRLAAEVQAG